MKKHYLFGLAISAAFAVKSQTVVDFESTILSPETYNNGSDLSGGFTYGYSHFSNYYDTLFDYNTGFSISNVADNTTPGYTNQYSAITGSGYNSSNYAVFYPDGKITMTPLVANLILSARITNTTYAALSMMNGDVVGKKFGDSTNAQGQYDGTNGEDYFILKIYGRTTMGDTTGMVEVVLADFRFADNSQDFILQDWIDVDLQALNSAIANVDYISFDFESSDIGTFGINTPTYFAMDDFIFTAGTIGLNELSNDYKIYPNPVEDKLRIENAIGNLKISDAFGKTVFASHLNGTTNVDFSRLTSGIYFVSIENEGSIFTKKVIK